MPYGFNDDKSKYLAQEFCSKVETIKFVCADGNWETHYDAGWMNADTIPAKTTWMFTMSSDWMYFPNAEFTPIGVQRFWVDGRTSGGAVQDGVFGIGTIDGFRTITDGDYARITFDADISNLTSVNRVALFAGFDEGGVISIAFLVQQTTVETTSQST